MRIDELDRRLLRGILQGLSVKELADRTGMPAEWIEERSKTLMAAISATRFGNRSLPIVEHPSLARLLQLWNARRKGWLLPVHGTLRLTDLQPWMAHVAVIEMVGTPSRPKVRLFGRKQIEYLRGDMSGRYVEDFVPEDVRLFALEPYMRCAQERLPQYSVLRSGLPEWKHLQFHRLLLPHARDGCQVDVVVTTAYVEGAGENPELPDSFYELRPRKVG